ncbi:nucleoside/nucleotide kinase family protein [Acidithiobacillus sp.]
MIQPKRILVLSGTPASGKDTITALMEQCSSGRYRFFKKHKGVPDVHGAMYDPRNAAYHLTDQETFSRMAQEQRFLQHHERYGCGYGVSIDELEAHWACGQIPIIHNGRQENLPGLARGEHTLFSVLLLSGRLATRERILSRNGGDLVDVDNRIRAFHEERHEIAEMLEKGLPLHCHMAVSTDSIPPDTAAHMIVSATDRFWFGVAPLQGVGTCCSPQGLQEDRAITATGAAA